MRVRRFREFEHGSMMVDVPAGPATAMSIRRVADLLDVPVAGCGVQADSIVCAYESPPVEMTPDLWARVLAERKRLGRALQCEEVEALYRADGGQDLDL